MAFWVCLLTTSLTLRMNAAEILSLSLPRPPENLGFRLPLTVTTIQKPEIASGKNLATVDVLDIRELLVSPFRLKTLTGWGYIQGISCATIVDSVVPIVYQNLAHSFL